MLQYPLQAGDRIKELVPSRRGELEITDVNNSYLREGPLTHSLLEGWWTDAGTFESLRTATNLVAETGANKINTDKPEQMAGAFKIQ